MGNAPLTAGRIYASPSPTQEFSPSPVQAKTDSISYYQWSSELFSGETRYWSNTLWRPFPVVQRLFPFLADQAGLVPEVYGRSLDGRELVAYHHPASSSGGKRPTILITSGFHPMEGDTVGTEAIFEWLATEGHPLFNHYNILLVPVVNPDGFARAYNGCNAAGINFFWDFRHNDQESCPEAFHLWNFIRRHPPLLYLDFHCYSVQGARRHPGPYVKPSIFYWGSSARQLATKMAQELSSFPGTKQVTFFAPSSLAYLLTREMNTIAFAKYHLHQDMGRDGMKNLAVAVVERALATLSSHGYAPREVLLRPYGRAGKTPRERMRQWLYQARYLYPRTIKQRLAVLGNGPHLANS